MKIENFEEAFKGILAGLDYLTIKKLEYEKDRRDHGDYQSHIEVL